jgi:hypothetical protein
MNSNSIWVGLAIFIVILVIVLGSVIAPLNREAALRSDIEAHLAAREAKYDTMKKIIMQNAQLPAAAKKDLLELLPTVASGRAGGSIFKSVQERYPEFTLPLYKSLSRAIEAQREGFLVEQKELFDVNREHNTLMRSVWGGMICKMFGRKEISIKVISSTEAKEVVESGVDDNTDLRLNK